MRRLKPLHRRNATLLSSKPKEERGINLHKGTIPLRKVQRVLCLLDRECIKDREPSLVFIPHTPVLSVRVRASDLFFHFSMFLLVRLRDGKLS